MKKLFIISVIIIFCGLLKAQDTVVFNNQYYYGKITHIDKEGGFMYFIPQGKEQKVRLILRYVNRYVLMGVNSPESINENLFITEKTIKKPINTIDTINYKMAFIQYNLNKYKNESSIGTIFLGLGVVVGFAVPYIIPKPTASATITDVNNYTNTIEAVQLIAAGTALVGTIIILDSYKWIKRASIEPTLYGVKLKINF